MATQPSDTPRWYTASGAPSPTAPFTGSNAPPSAPKQTAGWDANEAIPNTWLNWLFFYIWAWIYYFKADINTGRDPTVGYGFDPAASFTIHRGAYSAVLAGHSAAAAGVVEASVSPYVRTTATGAGGIAYALFPIEFDVNNDIAGTGKVITAGRVRYKQTATGGTGVAARLERTLRDGTGGISTVHTWTLAGTGAEQTDSESFSHTVDPLYAYWFAADIISDASVHDTYVKSFELDYTTTRVL